ncbi:MAG TPA: hypothetical protein VF087_06750 [Solirubrobacteraceae bacterium]
MGIWVVQEPTLGEGWLAVSRAILVSGAQSAHVYEPEWSAMATIAGAVDPDAQPSSPA